MLLVGLSLNDLGLVIDNRDRLGRFVGVPGPGDGLGRFGRLMDQVQGVPLRTDHPNLAAGAHNQAAPATAARAVFLRFVAFLDLLAGSVIL